MLEQLFTDLQSTFIAKPNEYKLSDIRKTTYCVFPLNFSSQHDASK